MSIGQINYSAAYRGDTYSVFGVQEFRLCNGQVIARSAYPDLSNVWPDGAYGSTPTNIHLPNLGANGGYFFRGCDFSRGVDPSVVSRAALSGTLPVTSGVGSLQPANMALHTHPSGVQQSFKRSTGGGDGNCCYPINGTTATSTPLAVSGPTSVSTASATDFDVAHIKFYPYIRVL